MSINGAMLAGVSGLAANAAALSSISQNISNVNTVGYKRIATEFSTVVNTQSAGVSYSAGGVKANTRQFISQGGQLQRTTSSTDLAIGGDGFFVGPSVTVADTSVFGFLELLVDNGLQDLLESTYPGLFAFFERMKQRPNLARHLASPKRHPAVQLLNG